MLCPHADDGAITAACLLHEYAVRRGLPVIEVLVFAGERNVAAPWLNDEKKITVREGEFRLECNVLGAEGVCWNLECYNRPGYQPTEADIDQGRRLVHQATPRRRDRPAGQRRARRRTAMTRALAAVGLVGAEPVRRPGPLRLDPLGPAPPAQRLFHLRRRGRAHQGMGDPLPRLAGPADRLYPVLLAPGPGLRGPDPRVGRGAQPRRAGPPQGRPVRGRGALPDRVLRRLPMPRPIPPTRSCWPSASWAARSALDRPARRRRSAEAPAAAF